MSDVDKTWLIELAGGPAEACELVHLFLSSARDVFSQLCDALARQDRDALNRTAHQMAGAAGTCGFVRLEEHLRFIETHAGEADWADLRCKAEEVPPLLSSVEAEARNLFSGEGPGR